jgi:hypothetical protein
MVRKLLAGLLASTLLGACATAATPGDVTPPGAARDAPKEDFVTGSRLRRADSPENPTSKEGGK